MNRKHLIPLAGAFGLIAVAAWAAIPTVSLASADVVASQEQIPASAATAEDKDPFPLRKKYPQLKCITTEEMAAMRATSIVIDARNTVEYDVIHIDDAVNLPASFMKREQLLKIRAANGDTPLIFYCNGTTCTKSYKGCEKARSFGFKNIFVYDAGVMAWALDYPSETKFFGRAMTEKSVEEQLISKETFLATCVEPKEFIDLAKSGGWKIYDLRDRDERSKSPIKLPGIIKCDVDKFVAFLEKPGAVPKSKILVMDWVGKQVKWAQYYLERKGHTNYHFLAGGVKQWTADGYDARGKFVGKPDSQ